MVDRQWYRVIWAHYQETHKPSLTNNTQTFSISRTLVDNKNFDRSDVVEASSVGAAPATFSFST